MNEPVIKINSSEVDILEKANTGLSITYSIAEIINIDERTSARTKSINIPATKKNNKIIGFGTDINSKSFLSQNDVITGSIEVVGIDVINGVAKMVGSKIASDGTEGYQLTIAGDNGDWRERIRGKSLKDLDFSKYDHVWNKANIDLSETTTGTEGTLADPTIVYPLINYGAPSGGHPIATNFDLHDVLVQDRFPAIQLFAIVQKILNTAGHKVESIFLNSDFFKRLYLCYTGKFIKSAGNKNLEFRAGELPSLGAGVDFVASEMINLPDIFKIFLPFKLDSGNDMFDNGNNFTLGSTVIDGDGKLKFISEAFFIITTGFNGQFIIQFEILYFFSHIIAGSVVDGIDKASFEIQILRNNVVTGKLLIDKQATAQFGGNFTFVEIKTDIQFFFPGDKITFIIDRTNLRNISFATDISNITIKKNTARVFNIVENNYVPGSTIVIKDVFPDIQQTDFLKSVINMYNLYFVTDTNNRIVKIEPRDNFYKSIAEDWTDKLDLLKEIDIQWLGDKVGKNLIYQYADDSNDAFVKDINERQPIKFGTRKIENKNRFSSGEKTISANEFAPTFMNTWNYIGLPLSKIPQLNKELILFPDTPPKNTEFKPRILYYQGITAVKAGEQWFFEGIARTTYPYMYSYEDDIDNDNTLLFNNTRRSKGLWERFHRNLFDTITEGKLMIAWFNLSESDISKLDFRTPIFVKDAYYILNKVDGFQPGAGKSTKMELIYAANLDANILIKGKETGNSGLTVFTGGSAVSAGGDTARLDANELTNPVSTSDDSRVQAGTGFAEASVGVIAVGGGGVRVAGGGNRSEAGSVSYGVGVSGRGGQVVIGSYPAEVKEADAFVIGTGTRESPATGWSIDKRGEVHPSGGNFMKLTRNGNVVDMELTAKDTGLAVKVIEKHSIEISKFLRTN